MNPYFHWGVLIYTGWLILIKLFIWIFFLGGWGVESDAVLGAGPPNRGIIPETPRGWYISPIPSPMPSDPPLKQGNPWGPWDNALFGLHISLRLWLGETVSKTKQFIWYCLSEKEANFPLHKGTNLVLEKLSVEIVTEMSTNFCGRNLRVQGKNTYTQDGK